MGLTVGAMVPTTEVAMALGPSLMTVFIVFGGYNVNAENTPIIFRWIPRVSLIRWQPYNYIFAGTFRAFQGLCINEFSGLQFDHQHSFDLQTGEQLILVVPLLLLAAGSVLCALHLQAVGSGFSALLVVVFRSLL
ncbi:ABC transporter G member 7 [Sarracenia purpurea var. burkii]